MLLLLLARWQRSGAEILRRPALLMIAPAADVLDAVTRMGIEQAEVGPLDQAELLAG